MAFIDFNSLMMDAEKRNYAVGYFESWNIESLLAVCDAAEKLKSPVIVGFSGLYLTHQSRVVKDPLLFYATLAREACDNAITGPACSIFNESEKLEAVLNSIDQGYGIVMYADPKPNMDDLIKKTCKVVDKAHKNSVAVEAEIETLPGLNEEADNEELINLTDPDVASNFVLKTKIDALAVNIGQAHKHGKEKINIDLDRLNAIREKTKIPLVLHGGSYLNPDDVNDSINLGVRKINVGSILKQTYIRTLKNEINNIGEDYNPYEILGSGFNKDILVKARLAVQQTVESFMKLYRSAGKS